MSRVLLSGLMLLAGLLTPVLAQEGGDDDGGGNGGYHSLVAGSSHFCVLNKAGAAFCWGANSVGELGNGTTTNSPTTPVPVAGGLKFRQLAAGSSNTCGITNSGEAYCWGDNVNLQLGVAVAGSTCPSPYDGITPVDCAPSPVAVTGGHKFSQISTGGAISCGIEKSGDAYCWGAAGLLGQGPPPWNWAVACHGSNCISTPLKVPGLAKVSVLNAGQGSFYDTPCAVIRDGKMYCWGDGQYGTLGDGTGQRGPAYSPIQAVVPAEVRFDTLTKGAYSLCGSAGEQGVWCWGGNVSGALGVGTAPEQCATQGNGPFDCSSKPIRVGTWNALQGSSSVGGERLSFCALDSAGHARCWGDGSVGALGNGTYTPAQLTPVLVSDGHVFREIAVSGEGACALSSGESKTMAFCWGDVVYTNTPVPLALP